MKITCDTLGKYYLLLKSGGDRLRKLKRFSITTGGCHKNETDVSHIWWQWLVPKATKDKYLITFSSFKYVCNWQKERRTVWLQIFFVDMSFFTSIYSFFIMTLKFSWYLFLYRLLLKINITFMGNESQDKRMI